MVRHKNRYIVVKINREGGKEDEKLFLSPFSLYNSVIEKLEQLHGDFGVAACRAGFVAKYCNEKTRIAVIRVRHGPHKLVTSTLPFINMIEHKRVTVSILYIGATIRRCFQFLKKYQQDRVERFCAALNTEEEKKKMKELLMDFSSITSVT